MYRWGLIKVLYVADVKQVPLKLNLQSTSISSPACGSILDSVYSVAVPGEHHS
jgi:hypothetical protein